MAVQTSIGGEVTHSSALLIEAGYGRADFQFGSSAETVTLDLEQLEYPFRTVANTVVTCYPGSFIAFPDGGGVTATAIQTPDAVFTAGDVMDGSGSNEADVQFGQGAAIFEVVGTNGDSDRFYVKLGRLSYPFHFQHNGSHIDTIDLTTIGENSMTTSA